MQAKHRCLYAMALPLLLSNLSDAFAAGPIDIGSQRELFVDSSQIESMKGMSLLLHQPVARDVAIVFDEPWEGSISGYVTVFQDDDTFRMYYRASRWDKKSGKYSPEKTCYAESVDGIHWVKPKLGLVDYEGSKENNIIASDSSAHNFAPFKDTHPECEPDARYKAFSGGEDGLIPYKSRDGLRWSAMQDAPVITDGKFDSQNLAFYDTSRNQYVCYFRDFRGDIRDIKVCTSRDFINWTQARWLDWGDVPDEQLYTNAVTPYPRAPHIYVGFPMRFVPSRHLGSHPIGGVSDGVFMSSRDGMAWHRWREAFIRPGLQAERWVNRNNMTAWGVLITTSHLEGGGDELSFYSSEGYYQERCRMRRYTLRLDGFVSVHADARGGEMTTKPLTFTGNQLKLNYATSAAGSLRVELQTADGQPVPGFTMKESVELFGDTDDGQVRWTSQAKLSELAGQPIRLRVVMADADLYAMQFVSPGSADSH